MAGISGLLDHGRLPGWPARIAGPAARAAFLSALLLMGPSSSLAPRTAFAAGGGTPDATATGDLPAIRKSGTLRLLVTAPEHLQRAGDPKREELALAVAFAKKLGLRADPVVVSDRSQLIPALRAGRGDVIVGSLAVTPERAKEVAFTRPVRRVAQQVVVPKTDRGIRRPSDLAGKTVTVRASSSYASTLARLQPRVKGLEIKPAPETADTFDLIQKVARGEEAITVADSDILAAALTFEPGVKAAFTLVERDVIAWGVRKENTALKAALDAFLMERTPTGYKDRAARADLDAIRKRGALRVLTRNSSTTYFLHRGEELGFEYELVREFARTLGVRLELVIPPSREALATYLREGKGDLIAAGLAVTPERSQEFAFTTPYNRVSELLVVPAKDRTTRSLADLRGRKIGVRRSSSYYQALAPLQAQHGFELEVRPEDEETEDILEAVAEGKLAATVADSNIIEVELTYSDAIRGAGPIGDIRDIAWMLRKDQPQLRAAADRFIRRIYRGTFYNMTMTKYFKNQRQMRTAASEERSDKAGELSSYDALVKKYATMYEFDWRLITRPDVPGVALRPERPELGGSAGADAGDAAHGSGARRRRRAAARAGDPGRGEAARAILGHVPGAGDRGAGPSALHARRVQLRPRPRRRRPPARRRPQARPESLVRPRGEGDAAPGQAAVRPDRPLRVLPLRRAGEVRQRDPAPLRVLLQPDRAQLTDHGRAATLIRDI